MGDIWCIKAGSNGEADSLFQNDNLVALAWSELGDLSDLARDKNQLKIKISTKYPDLKKGAIPVYAGILNKFVCDMKIGDIVVYPSKIDKLIHIGAITSDYKFDPSKFPDFPNQRQVEWKFHKPRTDFSQSALFEIGSLLALIQVKSNANEFERVVSGKPVESATAPDSVEEIDYEQAARDFVTKQVVKYLKGHPFSFLMASIFEAMGYRTKVSPPGPDHGIDIVATKDAIGTPPLIKIQCKGIETKISEPEIGYFDSDIGENEIGIFINFGQYSKEARTKAFHSTKNLRLWDQDDVIDLIFEYYESLDQEFKRKIPLKKVFVPIPEIDEP